MTAKLFQLNFFVLVLNWNITVEHYRKKIGLSMRYTDGYFELLPLIRFHVSMQLARCALGLPP